MFRLAAFQLLLALAAASFASAQDRFALVIGNGNYAGASALKNPPNDAAAVAAALEKLDFQVTKKIDADLASLEKTVLSFRKSLTKKSIALFFYAGHGLQVKGENYLVPVDADVQEESQVKRKCYPVDEVLNEFDGSDAALKIVILDSCRDNPLSRSWSRSAGSGLATIAQVPDGTIIAFSTAPGKTALDGRGANSPFTKHLVASLNQRPADGLEVIHTLRLTGQAVSKEIGQRPWLNFDTSLEDFYLWRDVSSSATASLPKPTAPFPMPVPTPKTTPMPSPTTPDFSQSFQASGAPPRPLKLITHPHNPKFETLENSIGMKFVTLSSGEFMMGAADADELAQPEEKPRHRVKISRFFCMGMYEVTLGQFLEFYHKSKLKTDAEKDGKGGMGWEGEGGYKQSPKFVAWTTGFEQTNSHPVVNVSWNDAQAFCKWLSDKEGLKYRLPTEAEWEYGCRSGFATRFWTGDNYESIKGAANLALYTDRPATFSFDDEKSVTVPVGRYKPNEFGLYDMHGNVWEWCQDGRDPSAYRSRKDEQSTDPVVDRGWNGERAKRGGGHAPCENKYLPTSSTRHFAKPEDRDVWTGFRVVLEHNW